MKKQNTSHSYLSIKKKLITTVAMLLVATFMVASSSYAWFTLSTAPEVTGIKTSVGSNGSLEIALVPADGMTGISSNVGDSNNNETWGNLVDLSSDDYGLQDIALYPSVIVLGADGKVAPGGAILATPEYGADGRVSKLNANAVSGKYDGNKFVQGTEFGVTALGTASGMSSQQLAHMNAKSAANSALNLAKANAEAALAAQGAGLVNIVLTYVNNADSYDIAAIGALLEVLAGTGDAPGVVDYIEEAMTNYIVACAATANPNQTDAEFEALKALIEDACTAETFPAVTDGKITISTNEIDVSSTILPDVYAKYVAINEALTEAQTAYTAATQDGSTENKTKEQVTDILSGLMDISQVTVNEKTATEFSGATKEELGAIAGEIMAAGAVVVDMPAGSGVFADIASVTANIQATFRANVAISMDGFSITVPNMPVNMNTTVGADAIKNLYTSFPPAPANRVAEEGDEITLTSLYGYSLDFAFRTNAPSSNLMLQTTPANRIYSSGGSAETQGNGSTMTFSVVDSTFTAEDIQDLIANIRIVFTGEAGDILATAKLDTDAATTTGNSVTADIKLCYHEIIDLGNATGAPAIKTLKFLEFIAPDANSAAIVALDQNIAKMVSVYVYLDGQTVDNSNVASKAAKSATGTMNLQFSSDAELVPMDYADLMAQ